VFILGLGTNREGISNLSFFPKKGFGSHKYDKMSSADFPVRSPDNNDDDDDDDDDDDVMWYKFWIFWVSGGKGLSEVPV
jgi:hypothetical protein